MAVIRGTRQNKKQREQVTVVRTGHPAAFRKMRCPKCSLGYAVADNEDPSIYKCQRCGHQFKNTPL